MKKHEQLSCWFRVYVRRRLSDSTGVHDDIVEVIQLEVDDQICDDLWFQLAINVNHELVGGYDD